MRALSGTEDIRARWAQTGDRGADRRATYRRFSWGVKAKTPLAQRCAGAIVRRPPGVDHDNESESSPGEESGGEPDTATSDSRSQSRTLGHMTGFGLPPSRKRGEVDR